jgi:hypothetical protein
MTPRDTSCASAFSRRWAKLQISHRGGKYSVERLLLLSEYTKASSLQRVLLVCMATPMPMIIFLMLQELIPLQDPQDGWKANYGFWIRYGILAGTITFSMAVQATHMIDGFSLSTFQVAVAASFVGLTFPFVGIAVSALWIFPVPFIALLLNTPFVLESVGVLRIIAGREVFTKIIQERYQALQFFRFITVQMLLSLAYPAYQVLFEVAAGTSFELPVILLLPAIKLVLKNLLSHTIPHLEDMLPLEIIFVVDFFNAFYLVTCVQSASSTSAIVAILTIDISQSALELYRMNGRTRSIAAKISHMTDQGTIGDLVLLNAVQTLCETPEKLDAHLHTDIRLRSNAVLQTQRNSWLGNLEARRLSEAHASKKSQVSPDSSMVQAKGPPSNAERSQRSLLPSWVCKLISRRRPTIQPLSPVQMSVKPSKFDQPRTQDEVSTDHPQAQFLSEALEMIFTAECVVLTEYLEAIIPVLYGCYVKVLVYLPSAKYHIELEGTTVENVDSRVQSVFVYASLEFRSLAVLITIMYRNCGVRALYQLAFVLETQMQLVQCKLIAWGLITLCFRVVHFGKECFNLLTWYSLHSSSCCCDLVGVDFTFRFSWIE